jgi:hypothetical protein
MNWKDEFKSLGAIVAVFLGLYFLPVGSSRFDGAVMEALHLVKWYAREHVLLCLVPAFFIAGGISVFVSQGSVMKYLGANAPKALAYGVASISGTVLAVCSCTVLPLFAGIWRMGAGLGPASAFLYSGPAINVLAIILTARILGMQIGIARAVGAILFSIVIGLLMHLIYRKEEAAKAAAQAKMEEPPGRPLYQTVIFFALMIAILVFANWARDESVSWWHAIWLWKWPITALCTIGLGAALVAWYGLKAGRVLAAAVPVVLPAFLFPHEPLVAFTAGSVMLAILAGTGSAETRQWLGSSWTFAKQILPLLLGGVVVAGLLLGRPGHEGLIPSPWVANAVGGNSLGANFFASLAGALMYFATLTEIPIMQGLLGSGMGQGPALALLLAGPALSLPSMLVLRSVMGTKKMLVFVSIVVVISTIAGLIYGAYAG